MPSGRPASPHAPSPVPPAAFPALAARLRDARGRLATRSLDDLIGVLSEAGRRARREGAARRAREAELATRAGYSPAMARLAYDEAFRTLEADRLRSRVRAEFRHPVMGGEALPDLAARGLRATAPELALVVAAGNVPVSALPSAADLLLLGSGVVWRVPRDEPVIGPAFACALEAVDPGLAATLAVVRWAREETSVWREAFAHVDTAVVYGGAAALAALRSLAPPSLAWVAYGPRLSVAHIARSALANEDAAKSAAAGLALDVGLYDQRGCLSPQFGFVETGGAVSPGAFAELLAGALASLEARLPAGAVSEGVAAAILRARAAAEFGGNARLWWPEGGGTAWTVVLRGPRRDAAEPLPPSPGGRFITLVEVADLDGTLAELEPFRPHLSTLGLAPAPDLWTGLPWPRLSRLGFSRVVPLGRMQFPAPDWPHDGRPNLMPLLNWIRVERPLPPPS